MSIDNTVIKKKLNQYNGRTNNIIHSKNSDLALENKYVFFRGFDVVHFPEKINWNYRHKHTAATYQIYLHCLHIVRDLTDSYLTTNNEKYALKARNLIYEWLESEHNQSFNAKNSSWKDHSAASRMKNFVYFQFNIDEKYKIDTDFFEKTLDKHCEFLSLREFYSENNHGMMSDEALLFLSSYLEDTSLSSKYTDTAILRMERIIYKLFSSSSYNLENSPEYHRLTQNLSTRFIRLIDILEYSFDQRCRDIIAKSYERNKMILKPDNTYPLIGDTGLFKANIKKSFDNFIDYQAGLAFLNAKNPQKLIDSTYLSFKAGYLTRSHKHRDDLSLTYYFKGEDILIDSGKYTYDRKNPKKSYIVSPQAHSTIYKVKEVFELDNIVGDVDKVKLKFVFESDNYTHIGAINHLYNNIKIYRDVIFLAEFGLIVIDRYSSDEIQFMGQNFNLAPDIVTEKINTREYVLTTPKKQQFILKEHTERTLSAYFGHKNADRGFYSFKFNELLPTQQVEFRKNSFNSTFVTTLINKNEEVSDVVVDNKNRLQFNLNDLEYIINLQKLN